MGGRLHHAFVGSVYNNARLYAASGTTNNHSSLSNFFLGGISFSGFFLGKDARPLACFVAR
jgi:hypothetical protein